jgi:sortase (surface protein transpeptidase)
MKHLAAGALLLVAMSFAASHVAGPGVAQAAPGCPWAAGPYPDPKVRVPQKGTLGIDGIQLQTPIFQGWLPDIETEASHALMHGPAFYPEGMVYANGRLNHQPGDGGTVGMLGHRTTRTHPFCLINRIYKGNQAVLRMPYGTFVYQEVGGAELLGSDWSAFERPERFDLHPKTWRKGIKPEYLVIGACDPPHFATHRFNKVFKLVRVIP